MDFFSYFRNCAYCKRSFFEPVDVFCESCWKKLLLLKRPHTRPLQVQKIDVYPLFIWSGQNSLLETLLYSLKGGALPKAFERLARELCLLYQLPREKQKYAIFPAPPSVAGQKDHAFELAKGIAAQTRSRFCPELEWSKKHKSQKLLNKKQRTTQDARLTSVQIFSAQTKIIIVDDVVTTGATIHAASMAIKSPNSREAWCISYRI